MPEICEDLEVPYWKIKYIKRKYNIKSRDFVVISDVELDEKVASMVQLHPNAVVPMHVVPMDSLEL